MAVFIKQYEKQKIELKNKEEIKLTKADEKKGLYTFKSNLNGQITLDVNKIDNFKAAQGLLHNYARTAPDAQGLSKDKGVVIQDGRMDANRLLVGLTRFKQDIKIKVSDVKAFVEDLSARQTKTSSLITQTREKENPEIAQEKRESQKAARKLKYQETNSAKGLKTERPAQRPAPRINPKTVTVAGTVNQKAARNLSEQQDTRRGGGIGM